MNKTIIKRGITVAMALFLLTACGDDSNINSSVPTADTTLSETTTAPVKGVIDGVTELYTTAFLPFVNGIGTMTFAEAQTIAEVLPYEKEITLPTEDDLGQIKIIDENGDYVWMMCYYDVNDVETLSILSYHHDIYEISTGDEYHMSPIYFKTYDKNRENPNQKASSLEECELFMFGSNTGLSIIASETNNYSLLYGELLDVGFNNNQLIIKAKIDLKNNTVSHNYLNVEDLIINQGCDVYDVIQYWAVADMTDGSESKVIAFDVPSSAISEIKNGTIKANNLENYVDNLFILPSLKN